MAIIRDPKTGQGIAQGTPLEMAALAQQLDGDVLFDDVGEGFDPQAVLDSHQADVEGLRRAVKDEKNADAKKRLQDVLKRTESEAQVADLAAHAEKALTAAHDQHDRLHG